MRVCTASHLPARRQVVGSANDRKVPFPARSGRATESDPFARNGLNDGYRFLPLLISFTTLCDHGV
jgi:hypothetical protein